jgi:hypothetical protein
MVRRSLMLCLSLPADAIRITGKHPPSERVPGSNREGTMAEGISVYGQVRSRENAPIFMIKVSVYRDAQLLVVRLEQMVPTPLLTEPRQRYGSALAGGYLLSAPDH